MENYDKKVRKLTQTSKMHAGVSSVQKRVHCVVLHCIRSFQEQITIDKTKRFPKTPRINRIAANFFSGLDYIWGGGE